MSDDSQQARARIEPASSFFPPAEGPSFCSRPTPVVPASEDLRGFGGEHFQQEPSGARAIVTPSSRPTMGPGTLEAYAPISSDRPTLSHDQVMAEMIERATVGTPIPRLPLPPELAAVAPRRRGRKLVARALFTVLFGGALALLGYAFQPRIVAAASHVREMVMPTGAR